METLKARLGRLMDCPNPRLCIAVLEIGPTRPRVSIWFREGGMDAVYLLFPTDDFDALRPIFVERYGKPTATRTEMVQNRMGAKFRNEILEWTGQRAYVFLRRYSDELTEGLGAIGTKAGLEAHEKERKQQTEKGKKDL
jgi:hypothetical protein